MSEVSIPDSLFEQVSKGAEKDRTSIEAFVVKALELHLADGVSDSGEVPDSFFTPIILAQIDAAREEARKNGCLTLNEVRGLRLAKGKMWRENRTA